MSKRNYSKDSKKESENKTKGKRNYRSRKSKVDDREDRRSEDITSSKTTIPMKNGDKNPNWYYTDAKLAEQNTQLAFQQLAGFPVEVMNNNLDVPNVVGIFMNPCPGVIKNADYSSTLLNKASGINLAGFALYSQLSAFTGRTSTYAPQDISTMILAEGEVLSMVEFIRRAFGVAFTINMRNRSYPRTVLEEMRIDPDDLFTNFANYRDTFNNLIMMVNKIPICKSIMYFDKCLSLYQEIYLDAESNMAQTLIPMPYTTWIIDEQSYSGGTILKTVAVTSKSDFTAPEAVVKPLSAYLTILDSMVSALLNSSTLNIVYTDMINYAAKQSMQFLQLDTLYTGYAIAPRYSREFLLQMHNATIVGTPLVATLQSSPHITPYNDVYPNPNTNTLYYNPGFGTIGNTTTSALPRSGDGFIIDMLTDAPDLNDRVEFSRFIGYSGSNALAVSGTIVTYDASLPDHYVAAIHFWTPSQGLTVNGTTTFNSTLVSTTYFKNIASLSCKIDWAPHFYEVDITSTTVTFTGMYTGDLLYYTTIGETWIRRVNQFIALALYTFR